MLTNLDFSDLNNFAFGENKRWMVLYTRSRREKMVAHCCSTMGLKHYLPLEKKISFYERKKVQTELPLFPGYLFCLADIKDKYRLMLTHHIAKVISVSNQKELLEDLCRIYTAENADMKLIPCEHNTEGRRAKIEIGPMRGLEGIISRIKGQYRIILNVNFLQRAAAVEVDRSYITILN